MAELEAERDVQATYFLMTRSDFYNLDSRSGVAALARLRELGHRVGLHGVYPDATLDDRFDPGRRVAHARARLHERADPRRGERHAEPYFDPATYRSDSNQHWRSGCPHDELAAGGFDWLQLLVHPEIWVYDGRDDARDDGVAARTPSSALRRQQLAESIELDLT